MGQSAGEYLEFEVGAQRGAIPIAAVVRVFRAAAVSPLPAGPGIILGLLDLHGLVIAVLDLSRRLGGPGRPLGPGEHFVHIQSRSRQMVLRVERALQVVELAPVLTSAATPFITPAGMTAGVARTPDGLILLHDVDAFLTQAEADALDSAMAALAGGDH